MKKSILFFIFAAIFAVAASTCVAHAADSKDSQINVHVSSSELRSIGVNKTYVQYLAVLIDGKKYELARLNFLGREVYPIHPGDYRASIAKDEAKGDGQFDREYEILFADGKTARYQVVGEFE